jgi:hypothetical protein
MLKASLYLDGDGLQLLSNTYAGVSKICVSMEALIVQERDPRENGLDIVMDIYFHPQICMIQKVQAASSNATCRKKQRKFEFKRQAGHCPSPVNLLSGFTCQMKVVQAPSVQPRSTSMVVAQLV